MWGFLEGLQWIVHELSFEVLTGHGCSERISLAEGLQVGVDGCQLFLLACAGIVFNETIL